MNEKNTEHKIIKIDFYSRGTVDVYYDGLPKIVRIEGELCYDYFVAWPDTMIWEDPPESWEWLPEKKGDKLTKSEQKQVMDDVKKYYGRGKAEVVFETKELIDYTCELAVKIHEGKMRWFTARRKLKKAFPDVPKRVRGDVLGQAYHNTR